MRPEDVPFGQKALELNFIQQDQLNRCVQVQREWQRQGSTFPIDQVMFHLKYLTANHINIINNQLGGGLPQQEELPAVTPSDSKEDITVSFFLDELPKDATQKLTKQQPELDSRVATNVQPTIEEPEQHVPSIGTFPKERYEILGEIENKGTEIIYKAHSPHSGNDVALKVIFGDSNAPNLVEIYEIK